jgi:hypothetical protein
VGVRNFRKALIIITIVGVVLHFVGWFVNHHLHEELRKQADDNKNVKLVRIGELRRSLEARQKKEIESYGWTEKEKGIARIPVERAASYYLRSLPH